MATLHVELQVRDFDLWREAFGKDAGGRQQNGVRRYRIARPVDDPNLVMLDLEFDKVEDAQGFLTIMRNDVWPSADKAPAKVGTPKTWIIETVESHEY